VLVAGFAEVYHIKMWKLILKWAIVFIVSCKVQIICNAERFPIVNKKKLSFILH